MAYRGEVSKACSVQCCLWYGPRVKPSIVGSLRHREVACSTSDRLGSNFESCVWRTVSSHSSHHTQEVLLAQFSLCVHKGGLKTDSFHVIYVYGTVHNNGLAKLFDSIAHSNFLVFLFLSHPVLMLFYVFGLVLTL